MENKLPHDSDFEKFVRQALEKTDGTPDDNTWANIAAQQSGRNFWLKFRHYGVYVAPVVVALILAVAGWRYFASDTASPAAIQPEMQEQTTPSGQPQVNAEQPLPHAIGAENVETK